MIAATNTITTAAPIMMIFFRKRDSILSKNPLLKRVVTDEHWPKAQVSGSGQRVQGQ